MGQEVNAIHSVQSFISCTSKQPALWRNCTHHGKVIPSMKYLQDRRFSNWSISSQNRGQQIKAGFIHKNKQSTLQNGSFLDLQPSPSTPAMDLCFISLS